MAALATRGCGVTTVVARSSHCGAPWVPACRGLLFWPIHGDPPVHSSRRKTTDSEWPLGLQWCWFHNQPGCPLQLKADTASSRTEPILFPFYSRRKAPNAIPISFFQALLALHLYSITESQKCLMNPEWFQNQSGSCTRHTRAHTHARAHFLLMRQIMLSHWKENWMVSYVMYL